MVSGFAVGQFLDLFPGKIGFSWVFAAGAVFGFRIAVVRYFDWVRYIVTAPGPGRRYRIDRHYRRIFR